MATQFNNYGAISGNKTEESTNILMESEDKSYSSLLERRLSPSFSGAVQATSSATILSNTTNALLGVSVFSVPLLFLKSGVLGGIILVVLVSCFAFETVRVLLVAQRALYQRTGVVKTYPQIVADLLGDHWSPIVKLATIVSCMGACTSLVVSFAQLCCSVFGMARERALVLVFCLLTLLSWVRSYRELGMLTTIGVLTVVFSVYIILFDGSFELASYNVDDIVPGSYPWSFSSFHHPAVDLPLVRPSVMTVVGPTAFIFTIHYCVLAMGSEALLENPWAMLNSRRNSRMSAASELMGGSASAVDGEIGGDDDDDDEFGAGEQNPLIAPLQTAYIFATVINCIMGIGGVWLFQSASFVR
jgi:hypothetical protein